MTLLRPGLLAGRSIALAGSVPTSAEDLLGSLGAKLTTLPDDQVDDEDRALEWFKAAAPLDALVCGSDTLVSVDDTWVAVKSVANGALIPAGAGAVVLLAPRPDATAHAEAVRDALENLARTLSVEWARYGVTATTIAPGSTTSADDVATLIAFVCSGAGGYYSGCRFELGLTT
jgi:hypothetical protein